VIDADLQGVEISVDGQLVATTPMTVPLYLPAGNHLLKAATADYREYTVELNLAPGDNRTLILYLLHDGRRAWPPRRLRRWVHPTLRRSDNRRHGLKLPKPSW